MKENVTQAKKNLNERMQEAVKAKEPPPEPDLKEQHNWPFTSELGPSSPWTTGWMLLLSVSGSARASKKTRK
jgi:hypothetical protein